MMRWNHRFPSGLAALDCSAVRGLLALVVAGVLTTSGVADESVYSSKARFRIPYQLDATEIQRLHAIEIQLHVTTDRGKNWRHVDSVPPVAGKFTFEAAQDGEYWFSVRTISENGRHHPSGPLTAGLKVSVDTNPPTLDLSLNEMGPGEVALQWAASDDNLDVETLTLEHHSPGGQWQAVQIVPTDAGETSWSVPQGQTVLVRGRIQDRAGHEVAQQVELSMSGAAQPQMPAAPARQARQPIAEGPPRAEPVTTEDPFARLPAPQSGGASDMSITTTLPVINPSGSDYSQFISKRETTPPAAAATPAAEPQPQPMPHSPAALPSQPVTSQVTTPQPESTSSPAPPRSRIRRVNSTNFQIGYVLEDVGPSGVSSVDLFLTEDNGRKWFHYGSDEDGQSPFEVTVPQDGTYGFAIRVRSGAGLSQEPPQPGDPAEMLIAVDRQPPQATLMPLRHGDGQRPSQLIIEWTMSDDELADRPVSLYYASHLNGPWQPITGWEPNSGRYVWSFGPDLPKQVYIRLEARDAAGNIARVDSPEPIVIDLSKPTARIIDVETIRPRN